MTSDQKIKDVFSCYLTNHGHGHVWPRPDGEVVKCGGPGLCQSCNDDAAMLATAKRRAVD